MSETRVKLPGGYGVLHAAPPGSLPELKPDTFPARCPNCGHTERFNVPWPPPWRLVTGGRPATCPWDGFILERVPR